MQASPKSGPIDNRRRPTAQHPVSRRRAAPGTARRSGADPAAPRAGARGAGSRTRGWSARWPPAGPARSAVSRSAPWSRPARRDSLRPRGALDHHRHLVEAREVHRRDHLGVEEQPMRLLHHVHHPAHAEPVRGESRAAGGDQDVALLQVVGAQRVGQLAPGDVSRALHRAAAARPLRHRRDRAQRAEDELDVGVAAGELGDDANHSLRRDHGRAFLHRRDGEDHRPIEHVQVAHLLRLDKEDGERDRQQGDHEDRLAKALENRVHAGSQPGGGAGLFPGFSPCICRAGSLGCQAFQAAVRTAILRPPATRTRSGCPMLDVMRSNAKSSLIALIFGAIILTFVFSFGRGSSGFRTRTPETWAARVNGELVTASDFAQAYSSRFRQMSAMRGGKYTTDNARQDNLKAETLKSLVDQELIAQQADDLGIRVSDAEVADAIARSPQFQQDGKFDFDYYKRLVENGYGMSVTRFEEAYRRDLLRGKVVQAAIAGANVSDDEVKAAWAAQHESVAIAWVRLKPGQLSEIFKDRSGFHLLKAEEERPARLQPLDEVRKHIAADLVKSQKAKELAKRKAEDALAQLRAGKDLKELYPVKKTEPGQFDFSAFTAPQTTETETFHPMGGYIPGVGQAPKLSAAVFAQSQAGAIPQAPLEEGESWYVFRVKSRERADPSKLDAEEMKAVRERLVGQKQGELYAKWVDSLRRKARIVENEHVLSYDVGPAHEAFQPDDF